MTKSSDSGSLVLPSISSLCLEMALYADFPLFSEFSRDITYLQGSSQQIECFCVDCERNSIFDSPEHEDTFYSNAALNDSEIIRVFTCARNENHKLMFWFRIRNEKLFKIAQYPSAADLATGEINKYRGVLGGDANEFSRAIGLAAHGVGIGAFVYLRRIIENLTEEAHLEEAQQSDWNEPEYEKACFGDKIKMLKDRLPDFLSKNPIVYSLLSKGVHELKEEECLDAFPVLKTAIELILDQKLETKKREAKIKTAQTEILKLGQKHK